MNPEIIYMLIIVSFVGLWMLAGFNWKPWRRYILPTVLLILLLMYPVLWWKAMLSAITLCAVSSLGYGTSHPYIIPRTIAGKWRYSKLMVAVAYNLPALVLGYTWFFIILPVVFMLTFWASNSGATEKDFTWKVCEGWTGMLIACSIIAALQNHW